MSAHTKGLLEARSGPTGANFALYSQEDDSCVVAAGCLSEANAARLVASWNDCEGADVDQGPGGTAQAGGLKTERAMNSEVARQNTETIAKLRAQRDELLEALRQIERLGCEAQTTCPDGSPMQFALADVARAAIAKTQGGAA